MQTNRCISCEKEIEHYPCPHCGFDASTYQQPSYALPCGHILHGRYLIGKVLGQGGFGITYVGWDLVLQYKCAIKEYYPNGQVIRDCAMGVGLRWSDGAQAENLRQAGLESFLKEARKMYKVDHVPGVVRVRDTFTANETAYIVMDYVEGQTLKNRLEQGGVLSWGEAKKIFIPVIAAMEQVHQAGLVHRDLSPDNLMLLPDGSVSILDLGAAKDLNSNNGASSMQVAKNGFSPIEQYTQRGGSGPWTDVYAMAATMYYSLSGKLPPTAVDRLEDDQIRWDLPQLEALPKHVVEAMSKALAVLAKDRTRSMGELLEQIQASPRTRVKTVKIKEEPQKTKEKPAKVRKDPSKTKKHPWTRILAALVALALIGGLVFTLIPPPEDNQLAAPTEAPAHTEQSTAPTEGEHVHTWAPATVGSPARCSGCGLMTGTILDTTLSTNWNHVAGVREDGSVIFTDYYDVPTDTSNKVAKWRDAVSVNMKYGNFCAVTKDGTVLALDPKSPVTKWDNIVKVANGNTHSAGLRKDGTVVTAQISPTRNASNAHLDTENWTDIADVAAGWFSVKNGSKWTDVDYTIGLKTDGTLMFASEEDIFPEARQWDHIVSIVASEKMLLGLKADGTVVSTPRLDSVSSWTDITQISCGNAGVVGLKSDGTVVTNVSGTDVSGWTDIVTVEINNDHIYGLKSDGTVAEWNYGEEKRTEHWTNIRVPKGQIPQGEQPQKHIVISTPQEPMRNSVACGGAGDIATAVGITSDGKLLVSSNNTTDMNAWDSRMVLWDDIASVSVGTENAVGLKMDGTVVGAGRDYPEMPRMLMELETWTDIVQVSAGNKSVMGLRSDGTVVTAAINNDSRYEIEAWTDIAAVAAGAEYWVGLKTDGTVVTAGKFKGDVTGWNDIVAISSSYGVRNQLIVGLKSDGTVVAAGDNQYGQCDVSSWENIVAIATGMDCTIGLKADGTVVAAGDNRYGQLEVSSWTDIVAVDAIPGGVVGIRSNGTAVSTFAYGNFGVAYWWGIRLPNP